MGPLTAAAAVYLAGGFFCLAGQILFTRIGGHRIRMPAPRVLFGCGSLFVLYMLALYLALGLAAGRRQVLEIGLMNYLWPAFTLLLAPVVLKKKASLILIPGTLLALAGVFLVLTSGHSVSFTSLGNNAIDKSLAIPARSGCRNLLGSLFKPDSPVGRTREQRCDGFISPSNGRDPSHPQPGKRRKKLLDRAGGPGNTIPGRRHRPVLCSLGHRHEERGPGLCGGLFLFHPSSLNAP